MNRKEFLGGAAAAVLAGGEAGTRHGGRPAPSAKGSPFIQRGIYFHDGFAAEPRSQAPLYWDFDTWRRQIDWLRYCGINTVEFATMLEFNRLPSTTLEHRKIAERLRILDHAHAVGMQFGYLLTNTVMSTVPPAEEPGYQQRNRAVTLCPREPGNFEKTIAIPRYWMDTYHGADFFEEFAADWGGCNCGKCGVPEYLRYVEDLARHLKQHKGGARLYADTWCISYWRKDPMADGWRAMFDREIEGSRAVAAALPGLPSNVHLALPCHHLYRPLTFEAYSGRAKTPVFPAPEDVRRVRAAGRDVLAWPHFLMDDDPYRPRSWGIVHSEVRYIRDLLQTLTRTGIARVIGNLYLPHLQLSNTFAYGRLLHNPGGDPAGILSEFARLVAHPQDTNALAETLIWIENNSFWQQQMPEDGRLPALPTNLDRAAAARLAATVRPAPGAAPLPVAPAAWLDDLRRSIDRMDWAA